MAKSKNSSSQFGSQLDAAFAAGNFYSLRKIAKAALEGADVSESDKTLARDRLNQTRNDPQSLIAGVLACIVALTMALLSIN